tara:strand:+ start:149 stop:496 length:348 start_codon:yes stop_codon:yes gene_type:complete
MKILNINRVYTHLNGDPVLEADGKTAVSLNKILANLLSGVTQGIEPAKAIDWAYKLYNDGIIKVDRTDFNKIKDLIQSHKMLTNLQIVQLVNAMEDSTEEDDAKEETLEEGTQEN